MEFKPSIQLSDAVIFQPGGHDAVLHDVNLSAWPGELIYLVGRVGSGKSSLLRTLYGELPLRVGRGYIAGFELHKLGRKQIPYLRRHLGIVFQDAQLLQDYSVYHNLEFVLRATGWRDKTEILHRIERVLTATNTAHKAHAMPHQLSGGERQRVAVARALLNNPHVILADEPTANLDPASTIEIMNLFCNIANEGCTVIISTHNLGTIRQFPARTLLLENHQISEFDLSQLWTSPSSEEATSAEPWSEAPCSTAPENTI